MDVTELLAHPDDSPRFQVFADQLTEHGDPLGELITLQLRLEQSPDDPALKERESKLLGDHLERWVSPELARLLRSGRSRRGASELHDLAVTWRRGFLDTVRVGPPTDQYETADFDLREMVGRVLALERAALLRRLVIGAPSHDDYPTSWNGAVQALIEHPVPKSLRHLEFNRGGYWDISSTELGDLSGAYGSLRHLQSLTIELGFMSLGAMNLPALEALTIITGGLSDQNLESLATGHLPNLRSLTLYLGASDGDHGCTVTFEALAPFFEGSAFPKLRHLGLANSSLEDDIAAAIVRSKVLPRLSSLDLSHGTLGRQGAEALLAGRGALAHLETLDLSRNWIPEELWPQLSTLAKKVDLADQEASDGDEDWRYVAVSE